MVTVQAFFSERLDNRKDRGATAVEYGLMVGLIAVAIIAAVIAFGDQLRGIFQGTSTQLNTETGLAPVTKP